MWGVGVGGGTRVWVTAARLARRAHRPGSLPSTQSQQSKFAGLADLRQKNQILRVLVSDPFSPVHAWYRCVGSEREQQRNRRAHLDPPSILFRQQDRQTDNKPIAYSPKFSLDARLPLPSPSVFRDDQR